MNTNGQMVECSMDNGKIIKCMEEGFLPGQIAEDMRVIILKIKNKVKEHFIGLTAGNILDNGLMVNNMEEEPLLLSMDKQGKENGITGKEQDGLMKFEIINLYFASILNNKCEYFT